jgi:histidinol-phosphate aminotransferase
MAIDGGAVTAAHPLARAAVRALGMPEPLVRDGALRRAGVTDLVSNVNPFGGAYARYPPAVPEDLQTRYAAFLTHEQTGQGLVPWTVPASAVLFTEGSVSAIDLLVRAFCEPVRDCVSVCGPTFPFYERAARVAGVPAVDIPLLGEDYDRLDVAGLRACAPKLSFLCSPNNPVGTSPRAAHVLGALEALPGLVVIDEAYVEFADRPSVVRWIGEFPRLVVLRTFSKAWGIAGARAGAVIAERAILDTLRLLQLTYGFGAPAQRLVAERLADPRPMQRYVELVRRERDRVAARLREATSVARVYPSEANFLFVAFRDNEATHHRLAEAGLLVGRARTPAGEALRIALGTPADNDRLLAVA